MTLYVGKLEQVDPRILWPREALDFTPWRGLREGLARALGSNPLVAVETAPLDPL